MAADMPHLELWHPNGLRLSAGCGGAPGKPANLSLRLINEQFQCFSTLPDVTHDACQLWIPICHCNHVTMWQYPHDEAHHEIVTMSGFWIGDDKLVTSTHFLNVLTRTTTDDRRATVEFLKWLRNQPASGGTANLRIYTSSRPAPVRSQHRPGRLTVMVRIEHLARM